MKHETTLLATVLALAGCVGSNIQASNEERLKLYQSHSTPVESFQTSKLQGRQVKWSPVGDQALVVYDESGQPLLLELPEKCNGLATARSVSLSNSTGTVTPGTDSVQLNNASRAGSAYYCRIGSARRIDMDAVKQARE